ncbi:MAG TPA: sulfatase-like hydrolase/transferase [Candidatus Polarisedimenticolia bacterium]|jgi:arylsulfatase A-like enzyme/tetratricopeptide (TPR) repeat protein
MGRLPEGLSPSDLNLVIVTLDTTRADRIGCYGDRDILTPQLDALAARGALFEQAHATAPLTLPSHSSIFTSRYPPAHGVRDNGGFFLSESEETLAEVLSAHGFATGGFVSAYVLDRRWGIAQGFDRYFDDFDLAKYRTLSMGDIQRRGDETLGKALDWIRDQRGKRFFAWLHLYDPHSPYDPPEPYATAYAGRLYDGEIAYVDSLIGELMDDLSRSGLSSRTLVVVVGDHGESLGEHKESGHAFFVYGTSTHVPLILSGPWPGLAGMRIPGVVSTIDIMPTVLELLGVHHAVHGQGRSLVPLVEGRSLSEPLVAYSESFYPRYHFGWSDLRTLRTDRYRFIEAPRPEIYDTSKDPLETENLAGALPELLARMRGMLARIEGEMGEASTTTAPQEMDEETLRKLAALGYIGSTVDTAGKGSGELADPKDKIEIVNRMHEAKDDQLKGDSKTAIEKLRRVVADAPEVIDAWFRLGNAYFEEREFPLALEMYRRTLALKPDHDWAMVNMANVYVEMGRIDDALVGYRRFLERDPANDLIAYRLAETLLDAGRIGEAGAMFRRVLEIAPGKAAAAVGLAAAAMRRGDPAGARAEVARALTIDPNVRNAHYNLALALEAEGNARVAVEEYRKEISLHPHSFKAQFNLSRLLGLSGDVKGQVGELRAAMEDNPEFHVGRYYLSKALLDAGDLAGAEREAKRALEASPENYYAPLGQYVLADVYARSGRTVAAQEAVRRGRELEARNLPPPPS